MTDTLIDVRLRQIRQEAEGICSYELVASGDAPLPPFAAGAHIDLHLPGGLVRSYSLVNAPADTGRYIIAVQREPDGRGGSAWLHGVPRVGDRLRIAPPANHFALVEEAPHSVFIAGGIGITPILSMLRRLEARGRPWRLHYAARSPRHAAFVDELSALRHGDVDFVFGGTARPRLDIAAAVANAPAGSHLYCCGPARMIDAFVAAGAARPAGTLHFERFAAAEAAATDGGFEVVLQRSGLSLAVPPGRTLLDTLLDHAVDVPYACSAGVCGTCRTRVLHGVPDHRDSFLTDEERSANDTMLVCCSGARSKTLVLDL